MSWNRRKSVGKAPTESTPEGAVAVGCVVMVGTSAAGTGLGTI